MCWCCCWRKAHDKRLLHEQFQLLSCTRVFPFFFFLFSLTVINYAMTFSICAPRILFSGLFRFSLLLLTIDSHPHSLVVPLSSVYHQMFICCLLILSSAS